MFKYAAASVIALTAALPAQAQTIESETVIVTGSATPVRSVEALQSVDVVSQEEIFETFQGSLGETLARLPGISTTSFGPAVGRPIIRGLGGDRVRILNNGIGAIDASAVSVDHASTSEAIEAERIEILRGPSAIAYGGNAVGGVINVFDGRVPTQVPAGMFDGQIVGGYTSVDDGKQMAGRIRGGIGALVLQFDVAHREADDFEIPGLAESARQRALEEAEHEEEEEEGEEHAEEEEAYGVVGNSAFQFDSIGGGASLVGDWGYFGVAYRAFEAEYGLPGHEHHDHEEGEEGEEEEEEHEEHEEHDEHEEGDATLVMDQTRWDARGALNLDLGPFSQLTFASSIVNYKHAELEPNGEIGTLFTNEGWEARAALVNGSAGSRWSGAVGVQVFNTDFEASGEEAFVPPVETSDFGIFAAQRLDFESHGFEGGLRVETRDVKPTSGADRSFDTVSGAVGAFWRPAEGAFIGVNLARTQRAPTDAELFSNGPHAATRAFEIGSAELSEETALSLDFTTHIVTDGWHVEIGAFYIDYSDFIFLAPTGEDEDELPVYRYLQDDATLWGGELFVERDWTGFGPWSLSSDLTLEYVRAEGDTQGDIPRIPPFSAIAGVELGRDVVELRAEVEYVTEQNDIAAFELPTDSYTFFNLSAVAYPLADRNMRILISASNVTDEEGRRHTSQLKDVVPLPGRSFRIALSQKF